ncbi:MAG: redox-regulated ATPase YchF, partial [Candidatus Magasanikbacteria bacterium]
MLSIGIVGLPNAGKSTLFNALVGSRQANAENYPFCTVEPNVGVVEVPDDRLWKLAEVTDSEETVPATIEFVDIAGLVEGAHEGEGLGNEFLSHISEVDAIAHVIGDFEDESTEDIKPKKAGETINLELIMSDWQKVSTHKEDAKRQTKGKTDKEDMVRLNLLRKLNENLQEGVPARDLEYKDKEKEFLSELNLLSAKPQFYVINTAKDSLGDINLTIEDAAEHIYVNAKLEEEMVDMDEEEAEVFSREFGLEEQGLNKLIRTGYDILDLVTFFTFNDKETRGWELQRDSTAPQAAGKIHSDFQENFIKAEVTNWKNFVNEESWKKVKEKGDMNLAGS